MVHPKINTVIPARPLPRADSPWRMVKKVLNPLASLRVTLVLFAISALLVLIGTLALDKQGMWEVVDYYFRASLAPPRFGWAWVEPITFFPRKWFPEMARDPEMGQQRAQLLVSGFFAVCGVLAAWFSWLSAGSRRRQVISAAIAGGLGISLALFTLIAGRFLIPGGLLIGGALTVNLLAAHTVRFTIQTRGLRLAGGLAAIAAGMAVGTLIILHGHNQEGLRGEPPFSWLALWWFVKAGLTLGWIACVVPSVVLAKKVFSAQRRDSKTISLLAASAVASLILAGVMAYLWILSPDYWIGEAAVRVLWQLFQGLITALVLMIGCILAFKKRAGIVLLHAGVGLLMFNELFVGMHAVEEQMLIEEGKASGFTISIHDVELAVADPRGPSDHLRVVAVPIARNGRLTSLAGDVIRHGELPFDVEILKYFPNARLDDVASGEHTTATKGIGKKYKITSLASVAGADQGANLAAAYVKFTRKEDGKQLGTYLLSQRLTDMQRYSLKQDIADEVLVDGKAHQVSLRYRRDYKPYSIYLSDVQKNDYLGTATPKDFSSYIVFNDHSRDTKIDHRIWMNNPMRYAGWTFYQSGYNASTGNETTTLQIVKNRGWMIPYIACMIVVVGMALHFVIVLIRFLNRLAGPAANELERAGDEARFSPAAVGHEPADHLRKQSPPSEYASKSVSSNSGTMAFPGRRGPKPADFRRPGKAIVHRFRILKTRSKKSTAWIAWLLPAAIVLLVAVFVARRSAPPKPADSQMNLYSFGELPVVYRGRAKPFDSLARDSLRVLSNRSTFKDESGERQPAIRWLLDLISDSRVADKHRVIRVTNLEVLEALGLERRKGFLYSYSELGKKLAYVNAEAAKAHQMSRDGTLLTGYQQRLVDLDSKVSLYRSLREGFRIPNSVESVEDQIVQAMRMTTYAKKLLDLRVPLAVPTGSQEDSIEQDWQPLAAAYQRVWLHDIARQHEADGAIQLGEKLAAASVEDRRGYFHKNLEAFALSYLKDLILGSEPGLTPRQVDQRARRQMQEEMSKDRDAFVQLVAAAYVQRIAASVAGTIRQSGFEAALTEPANPVARSLKNILVAYRNGNVAAFNREVAACDHILRDQFSVYETEASKTKLEAFFNNAAWLFNSWVLYIAAFVLVAVSWLAAPFGWYRPLNRAAVALVVSVFLLHTLALVLRVVISGRPPVTNLYSSAVFIGWGGVLISLVAEAIFRIGFGHVLAAIVGMLTTAIALFGLSNEGDTMGVMQAVLDTQFWLATHVVCITLGYSTMFLAGMVGAAYVVLGLFTPLLPRIVFRDWSLGRVLIKMLYGIACFAIFFSFYGTVLGGLWADESWGRFWGWDPKENGALMIVIWSALLLHARWAGIVKDRGMAVLAIGGNIVTAWSWFGVNQLGIGLHSYGFTEGVLTMLGYFVVSQLLIICLGMIPLTVWRSSRKYAAVP